MIQLDNISFEQKTAIIFGGAALFLSLIVGLVFGVGFGTVLFRSLLFAVFFAGLGFGIIYAVKRFVPELFEAVSSAKSNQQGSPSLQQGDDNPDQKNNDADGIAGETRGAAEKTDEAVQSGGFKEFKEDDYVAYKSSGGREMDSAIDNAKSAKLGKHIVVNEKLAKYEPKIMAQAVRTMLHKDE